MQPNTHQTVTGSNPAIANKMAYIIKNGRAKKGWAVDQISQCNKKKSLQDEDVILIGFGQWVILVQKQTRLLYLEKELRCDLQ